MDNKEQILFTAGRFLQLAFRGNALDVVGEGKSLIPLPAVPASQLDWVSECARRLWRDRHRCLATLLLVHPSSGRWTIRFPTQRCGSASVSWTVKAEDFHEVDEGWRLGGTFQAVDAALIDETGGAGWMPLAPAADGLHFFLVHGQESSDLRAFIRAGGELRPAEREVIIRNDWLTALHAALPGLTLA